MQNASFPFRCFCWCFWCLLLFCASALLMLFWCCLNCFSSFAAAMLLTCCCFAAFCCLSAAFWCFSYAFLMRFCCFSVAVVAFPLSLCCFSVASLLPFCFLSAAVLPFFCCCFRLLFCCLSALLMLFWCVSAAPLVFCCLHAAHLSPSCIITFVRPGFGSSMPVCSRIACSWPPNAAQIQWPAGHFFSRQRLWSLICSFRCVAAELRSQASSAKLKNITGFFFKFNKTRHYDWERESSKPE